MDHFHESLDSGTDLDIPDRVYLGNVFPSENRIHNGGVEKPEMTQLLFVIFSGGGTGIEYG
jgi:hypothetical protein